MVTDSPSQVAPMAQTKHSTVGRNPDGKAQWEKLHWLLIPTFSLRKKKGLTV